MKAIPVREIHEIELSSICNLACVYCPHPNLKRAKGDMPWETFERTLEHVAYLCRAGTQGEVSLTGLGEALLYPRFEEAARRVREVVGQRVIVLSTNGLAVTRELARLLCELHIGVYVSLHRPEVATPALVMLQEAGCGTATNTGFVDSSLDWAGQVEWHVSAPRVQCGYLTQGWAVVRQNGDIDACCMDAHDLHPIATVWDEPGTLMTHATPLCGGCNFSVPKELREAA